MKSFILDTIVSLINVPTLISIPLAKFLGKKCVPIPNKRTRFRPVDKNKESYPVSNKRTPLLLVKFLNIEPPGTTQINHCCIVGVGLSIKYGN